MEIVNQVLIGHVLEGLKTLPANLINVCITSPPYYGLRSYGLDPVHWPAVEYSPMPGLPAISIPAMDADLGLEPDPWAFVGHLVAVFREVRRVLRDDGILWLNMGDAYATSRNGRSAADTKAVGNDDRTFRDKPFGTVGNGLKPKDLMLMPHRVAMALQADGWWLRSDIPWIKRNPMPGSQQDRATTSKEYWFLLAKSERYYFDIEAIKSPSTNLEYATVGKVRKTKYDVPMPDGCKYSIGTNLHNQPGGRPTRSPRESDWFFDSLRAILDGGQMLLADEDGEPLALTVNPKGYKRAHFATFAPALIEPFVLASPQKVCADCGKAWERVVERKFIPEGVASPLKGKSANPQQMGSNRRTRGRNQVKTLGFRKSCQCPTDDTKPAVILDPFGGSGTVAKVAIKHNRDWILIELNEEYAKDLIIDRIDGVQRMLL